MGSNLIKQLITPPAIKISCVSKEYVLNHHKEQSLRNMIWNLLNFSFKNVSRNTFFALHEISFEVKKGEVIGIVGKNGAGKSTLLKIISQITKPTNGRIELNGRIASLLEVGTGFHPELTGRENIYLNGTILGMTRKEVSEKFNDIVSFSGVEKFIDTPVKHYSSGMYVRLAFAVAAHLEPEILIIDEVLAVGDIEFQSKCIGKMQDVANSGRTVLFVSHNMAAIKKLCTSCVLLENGRIVDQGSTTEILEKYQQSLLNEGNTEYYSSKYNLAVTNVNLSDKDGILIENVDISDPLYFSFHFTIEDVNAHLIFGVAINDIFGNRILTAHSCDDKNFNLKLNLEKNHQSVTVKIENILAPGRYIYTFGIKDENENLISGDHKMFTVNDLPVKRDGSEGMIYLNPEWNIK